MRTRVLTCAVFLSLLSTTSFKAQTTSAALALAERPGGDPNEIVLYVAQDGTLSGQNWIVAADPTAAGDLFLQVRPADDPRDPPRGQLKNDTAIVPK